MYLPILRGRRIIFPLVIYLDKIFHSSKSFKNPLTSQYMIDKNSSHLYMVVECLYLIGLTCLLRTGVVMYNAHTFQQTFNN